MQSKTGQRQTVSERLTMIPRAKGEQRTDLGLRKMGRNNYSDSANFFFSQIQSTFQPIKIDKLHLE